MQHLRYCLTIKARALYWQTFRAPSHYQTPLQRKHLCFTAWWIDPVTFWQSGAEGAAWRAMSSFAAFTERLPWVIPVDPIFAGLSLPASTKEEQLGALFLTPPPLADHSHTPQGHLQIAFALRDCNKKYEPKSNSKQTLERQLPLVPTGSAVAG